MSKPITPAIERFLKRWEKTKGFGRKWDIVVWGAPLLRSDVGGGCAACPLTALSGRDACAWYEERPKWMPLVDAEAIMAAADARAPKGEIRRRLLAAVGLSEPKP